MLSVQVHLCRPVFLTTQYIDLCLGGSGLDVLEQRAWSVCHDGNGPAGMSTRSIAHDGWNIGAAGCVGDLEATDAARSGGG